MSKLTGENLNDIKNLKKNSKKNSENARNKIENAIKKIKEPGISSINTSLWYTSTICNHLLYLAGEKLNNRNKRIVERIDDYVNNLLENLEEFERKKTKNITKNTTTTSEKTNTNKEKANLIKKIRKNLKAGKIKLANKYYQQLKKISRRKNRRNK